jgi:hypothetical protein
LVLQHGEAIDPLANVQVGQMKQLHPTASFRFFRAAPLDFFSPNRAKKTDRPSE